MSTVVSRRRSRAVGSGRLPAVDLRLDLDLDRLADEHAAGLEGLVPGEAERLAVELGWGREAARVGAPRGGGDAFDDRIEHHGPGHPVHGQVSLEDEPVALVVTDLRAGEGDLGELLGVEEVGAAQVLVALRVTGRDAGGVDRDLDAGL